MGRNNSGLPRAQKLRVISPKIPKVHIPRSSCTPKKHQRTPRLQSNGNNGGIEKKIEETHIPGPKVIFLDDEPEDYNSGSNPIYSGERDYQ